MEEESIAVDHDIIVPNEENSTSAIAEKLLSGKKRPMCTRCRRPLKVCWCQFLSPEKLKIETVVYILQHPYEESRCLQTAAMLVEALEESDVKLYRGKKFSISRYPELHELARKENSLLLFPSTSSVDLKDYVVSQHQTSGLNIGDDDSEKVKDETAFTRQKLRFNLFVLDGTWSHAKGIYFWNEFLHDMKQVRLSDTGISRYTIRTQPTDAGLSTVESVAFAIKIIEDRQDVYDALMKPLEALCNFQLQHGAVTHHSKEALAKSGLNYPVKNKKYKDSLVSGADHTDR